MYMNEDRIIMTILLIYLAVLGTILLVYLIGYILQGIGMYTMGKRMGKDNCWLAFIPYARVYFQGELAGPIKLKNREIKNPGIWILLLPILSGVIASVMWVVMWAGMMSRMFRGIDQYDMYSMEAELDYMLGGSSLIIFILGLVLYILVMIAASAIYSTLVVLVNRQIYKECTTEGMSIAHAVLGIFIPLYTSICFFIFRERVPVIPPMQYGPYEPFPQEEQNDHENPPINE